MEEHFTVELTGKAHVLLEVPDQVEAILVGFHGYGESPERALGALRTVAVSHLLRVAPMAPHHFYDRQGNVVASWMTRFRREDQIAQQVEYARSLEERLRSRFGAVPLFLFGFSQGVAAAYRAGVLAGLDVARIFCLGGDMPPEVQEALLTSRPIPVTLLLGGADRRFASKMEADRVRLREQGWPAEFHTVAGGHEYAAAAMEIVTRRIRDIVG